MDELTQRAKDSATRRLTLIHSSMFILGSSLVGIAFAAGWTPCIGPILASILFYASTTNSMLSGIALLAVYSLGRIIEYAGGILSIGGNGVMKKLLLTLVILLLRPAIAFASGNDEHMGDWGYMLGGGMFMWIIFLIIIPVVVLLNCTRHKIDEF